MKITSKNKLALLIILAVVAAGGAVYVKINHDKGGVSPATQQEERARETGGSGDPKTDNENYRRAQQAEAAQQNPSANATVYISNLMQNEDTVRMGVIVENQSQGTCSARFTSGNWIVNDTSQLEIVSSYYACGFNLPKSSFPSKGTWTANVTYTGPTASGTATPQTITIE